jgi:phosphoribosylformylglycinamidine synthase subunit PurSL
LVSLLVSDEALLQMSHDHGLQLSLVEMQAIRAHFETQSRAPSLCELLVFSQTWSEHCKHKEFAARIQMTNNGVRSDVDGLFRTFIEAPTAAIRAKYGAQDWVLSAFVDNAGVVSLDETRAFVLKVETHNSPSALDPENGAMTGVLGVNRDALGTGVGGAKLLFNTNVLCVGSERLPGAGPLLKGQMHPKEMLEGLLRGIAKAGNHCGVPTVNGAVLFDEGFSGKPLVYCGTGAVLQKRTFAKGLTSWQKSIEPGARVLMVGGAVGRDGLQGATFSSAELHAGASLGLVQKGNPFAQKCVSDFMEEACALGLITASTDNGAGGLSSSVGELAQLSGGARIDLACVPLKAENLLPWEILLSESQERMTLAAPLSNVTQLAQLALRHGTTLSDLGEFTASGTFDVFHGEEAIANLDLAFLHEGVPRKDLKAEWTDPEPQEVRLPVLNYNDVLLQLLGSVQIASRERIVRGFDHEVQGKTIVKPYMGEHGHAPQDAAVLRVSLDGYLGVAVASGICPKFGALDPYEMSAGAFDEAVRSLVSVGARLPQLAAPESWSACDNFCVPDSVYDEMLNPDGKQKLGKLVRMCEALRAMSLAFDIPMTSGKDSMKNDFRSEGVKISVPPTVLYTMVAKIPDVRRVTISAFKAPGDAIYLMGTTREELGGSELFRLLSLSGGAVPKVFPQAFKVVYEARYAVQEYVASSHDLSDGGLAVALAESCFGGGVGASVRLRSCELSPLAALFAESHGRLLVSVAPKNIAIFERLAEGYAQRMGVVTGDGRLTIADAHAELISAPVQALLAAYRGGAP